MPLVFASIHNQGNNVGFRDSKCFGAASLGTFTLNHFIGVALQQHLDHLDLKLLR
jgi:hypothetical protein